MTRDRTDSEGPAGPGTEEAPRCSEWARSVDLDPVGSVGSYRGYVMVEVPLPWPRDVSEIPYLGPISRWAGAAGFRVQALVPRPERDPRLVVHTAGGGDWWTGYTRRSGAAGGVSAEGLVELAESLAGQLPGAGETGDRDRDVLVCTHGRRDVCCGSAGTGLALELLAGGGFDGGGAGSSAAGGRVAVYRTSHTGGHRFAPTFLILPEGTGWAFADPDLVRSVVDRTVNFDAVAGHYRGCAGLGDPRVQAMEREVMRRVGWDLLDRPRRGAALGADSPTVRLEVRDPDGRVETWEADVVPGRTLPVPDCMRPLSEARKTETEWTVSGLRQP